MIYFITSGPVKVCFTTQDNCQSRCSDCHNFLMLVANLSFFNLIVNLIFHHLDFFCFQFRALKQIY